MAFDLEFILKNSPKVSGAIMELAIFHHDVCIPNTELLWDRRPSVARINAWVENYISNEKEVLTLTTLGYLGERFGARDDSYFPILNEELR